MGFFVGEVYTSCSLYCISYSYSLFILVLGRFAPWVSCAIVRRCAAMRGGLVGMAIRGWGCMCFQ